METIDGRYPFPRIAPPYRRGVREVVESAADVGTDSGLSAHVEMAGPDADTEAPPALVDNVETLANVARIIARGADWFRTEGTPESPGTIVCTVTGSTVHSGVGEVIMGTPLREVIEAIGGGARPGRHDPRRAPGRFERRSSTRRRARHARELRSAGRDRQRPRLGGLHRVRRRRRPRRGRGRASRDSSASSRAGSARRASTTGCASRNCSRQRSAVRRRANDIDELRSRIANGRRRRPVLARHAATGRRPRACSTLFPEDVAAHVDKTRALGRARSLSPNWSASPTASRASTSATPRSNPTGPTTRSTPASRPPPASANTANRAVSSTLEPRELQELVAEARERAAQALLAVGLVSDAVPSGDSRSGGGGRPSRPRRRPPCARSTTPAAGTGAGRTGTRATGRPSRIANCHGSHRPCMYATRRAQHVVTHWTAWSGVRAKQDHHATSDRAAALWPPARRTGSGRR